MSIKLLMSPNYLILCSPLLLLPSIFPSVRVSSNELARTHYIRGSIPYIRDLLNNREKGGGNRVLWKDRMRFFRENKRVFRRKITFIPLWHNFGLLHRNSFIDVQEVLFVIFP